MNPIVIIGSGLAGYTLARELRKLDGETPLTVLTAGDGAFYSKPMLSNALASGKTPAQLASQSADEMAAQLKASIHARTTVAAIDPAARRLHTSAGEIAYDRLVLALGARPIRLRFGGDGADEVLSVNDLAGYAVFRERLKGVERVAIIGAGLIGCEFADDLHQAGYAVTVFDLAPQPLGRLAPAAVSAMLRQRLEGKGITWRLGTSIEQIERRGSGLRLTAVDGSVTEAGLVLSAIGLQPETVLAREAGLHTARGIVTDGELRTSDPHIYALGDCAEVQGRVMPYVLPIMHGARALAATLAGTPTVVRYPPMPVVVKTPSCPLVVCPPAPDEAGTWREVVSEHAVRALFHDAGGVLRGFALAGEAAAERQSLTAKLGKAD